jgi:hypothetical protein
MSAELCAKVCAPFRLKVFVSEEAAERLFAEHDPEGVASVMGTCAR